MVVLGGVHCNRGPSPTVEPELTALGIFCSPQPALLACKAVASFDSGGRFATDPVDVTRQASWTTSNEEVATVDHGLVQAVGPGNADIRVSMLSRRGSETSTVSVLVNGDYSPQLAYAVEGELRDTNSVSLSDGLVTLVDDQGNMRTAATRAVGAFRFFPVPAGHYRVAARKSGFRSNEKDLAVPYDRPVTLVLLREPSQATPTDLQSPQTRSNQ